MFLRCGRPSSLKDGIFVMIIEAIGEILPHVGCSLCGWS
ncbi:unnamed protein product [Spirodela intermedia]|uniref:Uncharacterized protein n=1 Tax=Spirodela intermedia TaxID=51605 RepID=A0A7I8LE20_SPIIN|nr:unnamed protein product [Spirodela intermedia]